MTRIIPRMESRPFGDVHPGSVTTWWRKTRQAARERGEAAAVPCGACNACCRAASLFVVLEPAEMERLPHELAVVDGQNNIPVLPKSADGACVKLVDGKCSIYPDRPKACRKFDCRMYLFVGVHTTDKALAEGIGRWAAFGVPLPEDRELYVAARLAVWDGGPPGSLREAIRKSMHYERFMGAARTLITKADADGSNT